MNTGTPNKMAPPAHCQLRSAATAIQLFNENIMRCLAAISTFHYEGKMSLVTAELKHVRDLQYQHSIGVAEKMEAAICEASSHHRRHAELKQEHAELKLELASLQKKVDALEDDMSLSQAANEVEKQVLTNTANCEEEKEEKKEGKKETQEGEE
jgi:hypothetical protein